MAGMEKMPDLTDAKADKIVQKKPRTPSFTELRIKANEQSSERQRTGNTPEATSGSTSSSRDLPGSSGTHEDKNLELKRQQLFLEQRDGSGVALESSDGVGSLHEDMGLELNRQRLRALLDGSGVASESSDGLRSWQSSESKSRPDTNTSELDERAGSFGDWVDNKIASGVDWYTGGKKGWKKKFGKKQVITPGMSKLKPE